MKLRKGNLVFVFDLDKTIGYFTQIAIFIESIEDYIGRKLIKREKFKLFDLFPEIFRPDMMSIFKYLKKLKMKLKKVKILIYTNNVGPKSWVYDIKNYIEIKLKYNLFNRTIAAWMVDGKVYEKCRTAYEKKYDDLIKCGSLSKNDKIVFLDDMKHPEMEHKNVKYLYLKGYKHDILFEKMIKKFLNSNMGKKLIKNNDADNFKKDVLYFSREDPQGFYYKESKFSSRQDYKKEILIILKSFVKENKHNISKKKRKRKRKNITKKKYI